MYLEQHSLEGEVRPHNQHHHVWIIDEDSVSQDIIDEAFRNVRASVQLNYFGDLIEVQKSIADGYYIEPSLILVDLNLDSAEYEEAIQYLKSQLQNCSIVIWDNDIYMTRKNKFLEYGASDSLIKPFEVDMATKMLKGLKERYLN